jgi:hypothetical protein
VEDVKNEKASGIFAGKMILSHFHVCHIINMELTFDFPASKPLDLKQR